jgi:hypothetical protein
MFCVRCEHSPDGRFFGVCADIDSINMLSAIRCHRLLPVSLLRAGSRSLFLSRPLSLLSSPIRSVHSSAASLSLTGVSFSPVSPNELKVAQWLKKQEILARKKIAHAKAEEIWAKHEDEDWSALTVKRSEELLKEAGDGSPLEWDISEFFQHTLSTKVPWRWAELVRERKEFFEQCLAKVMRDLRQESDNYRHGTMLMTKNELTRKLTVAMGGKLPSAEEVDDAWQDRHSIPAIDWMEDAI